MKFRESAVKNIARGVLFAASVGAASGVLSGCHHSKITNPMAKVDSKQPDKVLFDRAMASIKDGKYEVARSLLQTMINTYPDSEFIARAKLAVADSWYDEGNVASFQQAEREYNDFITFFPNMPEAAEAQMKIANIHYSQMGKPDRDGKEAKKAEDAYRQMIQQFPDHKLVPEAKQRLREVQEVLGEREFRVGRFYYLRESWPAAIARLKTVADTYPLYSGADQALFMLGEANESEIRMLDANAANPKIKISDKDRKKLQQLKQTLRKDAIDAYDRVVSRYPAGQFADDAAKRLTALEAPVPKATPEMVAQNKAEIASRGSASMRSRMFGNFKHGPDMSATAKVGDPTLEDPQETSAPALAKRATSILTGSNDANGTQNVSAVMLTGKDASATAADTDTTTPAATGAAEGTATQPPAATGTTGSGTAAPANTAPANTAPAPAPAFESVPEATNATPSGSSTSVPAPSSTTPNTAASSGATGAGAGDAGTTTIPSSSEVNGSAPPAGNAPQQVQPKASDATGAASQPQATAPQASGTGAGDTASSSDNSQKVDKNTESSSSQTKKKKKKLGIF